MVEDEEVGIGDRIIVADGEADPSEPAFDVGKAIGYILATARLNVGVKVGRRHRPAWSPDLPEGWVNLARQPREPFENARVHQWVGRQQTSLRIIGAVYKTTDRAIISFMTKGEATREAIVSQALTQAVVLGLEGLSVGGIAQTMPFSKSGVFAHFRSREALQLEVLERAAKRFKNAVVRPAFASPAGPARLRKLFAGYLDWMRDGAGSGGCLFVSAAQEFDDRPGAVRDRLVGILSDWRAVVREVASAAKDESAAAVDVEQVVFEFLALALGFQQSARLMVDPHAESRAHAGLERLVATLGARS